MLINSAKYEQVKRENQELNLRLSEAMKTISKQREERDDLRATIEELRGVNDKLRSTNDELCIANEESRKSEQSLKAQVSEYKRQISISVKAYDQTADDVIAREADDIFGALQNFVVKNFKSVPLGRQVHILSSPLP